MTYTMARPNKFMDAYALEDWIQTEHPDLMEEWELEFSYILDLWDWLVEDSHDDILSQFEAWYNQRDTRHN